MKPPLETTPEQYNVALKAFVRKGLLTKEEAAEAYWSENA